MNSCFDEWRESCCDYSLTEECESEGKEYFEELGKESRDNIYPWDWMVNKEVNYEESFLVGLPKLTKRENRNKRKLEEDESLLDSAKKCILLSQESLDILDRLKVDFTQLANEEIFHHLLQFLSQRSLAEVEIICAQLEFPHIKEQLLINFTQYLITNNEYVLSINLMTTLIRSLFSFKVKNITQCPSRKFSTSLIDLTKKYPRPSFDGVCAEVIRDSANLSEFKCNLLCELLQESFPDEIRIDFLKELLNEKKITTEPELKLIQTIVDLKVPLDFNTFSSLISSVTEIALEFNTNLKFSRLIQSAMKIYMDFINENNINSNVEYIITNNRTVLQKSLLSLFRRTKTNI